MRIDAIRIVVVGSSAHLRARTRRSLARFDLRAHVICEDTELASALSDDTPTWVLRAGAWLASTPEIAPSATRKRLVAFGATRDASWDALLARTKGLLDGAIDDPSTGPHVASVLVEAPAMLRDALANAPFDRAVWSITCGPAMRAVRVHALDVGFDARTRVCIAVTALHRGGAERIALDSARALGESGVSVLFAIAGGRREGGYDAPRDAFFARDVATNRADVLAAIARAANAFGADVVHAHLFDAADLRALATAGAPPLVVTVHNDRARWPEEFAAVTCDEVSLTLGCSRRTTDGLARLLSRSRVRAAPNFVDASRLAHGDRHATRARLEIPPGALLVACVANPRPQKRLELAIETLGVLRRERNAHLVIAGDPHPGVEGDATHAAISAAIVRAVVEPFVRRVGSQRDIGALLAASDVLLTTSTYEGMSVAQLEALALGVPVVTTDVGGSAELARAHAGFYVSDPEPEALARNVGLAANGPRPALARAFTTAAAATRHERIYRGAASRVAGDALVLVINNFSTGGAQASARRLLASLRARGHDVAAAVIQEQARFPTPWRAELEAALPVFVAPDHGAGDPTASAAAIVDFVRSRRAGTVVFWNAMTTHKLLVADALVGCRLFDVSPGEMYFSALERYFDAPRADLPYFTAREYGALLEGVVVKFGMEASRAERVLGAPTHVIPNGVPLLAPRVSRVHVRERCVIGTLARISPDKKLEDLLAACDALPETCELRIAGRTERGAEAYANELRESTKAKRVTWLGEVESTAFLESLDVFAMISEPEGCPNALLEAMSASLPVAATRVGGAEEAIVDGEHGLLVARGDSRALGVALARLVDDVSLRERLGAGARARIAARFSLERMTNDYEALFFGTKR